jgi:hypothetical protein
MRFRTGLVMMGALVLGAVACSTSSTPDTLNMSKARDSIRKLADSAYGEQADVGEVKCPGIAVPLKKGSSFFCTVDIDDVPLRLVLRQTDSNGHVHIDQNQALIFTKKLQDFVAAYTNGHGKPTSGVRCGSAKVITALPGAKLTCTITFADGSTGTAQVGVRDTTGKVALLSVKP